MCFWNSSIFSFGATCSLPTAEELQVRARRVDSLAACRGPPSAASGWPLLGRHHLV